MCLEEVVRMGFRYETAISSKPGFELLSFVDPVDGRRLVLWYRTGRVTLRAVSHLLQLLKVRTDILMICFEKDVSIDEEAERLLREKFGQVIVRRATYRPERRRGEESTAVLYDGTVRVVSSGRLVLYNADRAAASCGDLWLLAFTIGEDGKVVMFDLPRTGLATLIEHAEKTGRKLVVLGICSEEGRTSILLLYPKLIK